MSKFCAECGTELNDEDIFCFNCGTKFGESKSTNGKNNSDSIGNLIDKGIDAAKNPGDSASSLFGGLKKKIDLQERGREKAKADNQEIRQKISEFLPEYAKKLNVSPNECYSTTAILTSEGAQIRGTKHRSQDRWYIILTIRDDMISYIRCGRVSLTNKPTYFKSDDIYSIPFKNVTSINKNRNMQIELNMMGGQPIKLFLTDYLNRRNIMEELLEKYNAYSSGSNNSPNVSPVQTIDKADTLLKYKDLLDQGIITQEEFQKLKDELING